MLAKKIKIKNLFQQRRFIEEQLNNFLNDEFPMRDGSFIYKYLGYILPENMDYFKTTHGFSIVVLDDEKTLKEFGSPLNIFTISIGLVLNDDELKQAEAVKYFTEEDCINAMAKLRAEFENEVAGDVENYDEKECFDDYKKFDPVFDCSSYSDEEEFYDEEEEGYFEDEE